MAGEAKLQAADVLVVNQTEVKLEAVVEGGAVRCQTLPHRGEVEVEVAAEGGVVDKMFPKALS